MLPCRIRIQKLRHHQVTQRWLLSLLTLALAKITVASGACSFDPAAPVRSITEATGGWRDLNSSSHVWDFGASASAGLLAVDAGVNATIHCLQATNVTLATPTGETLILPLTFNLSGRLTLRSASLVVSSCSQIEQLHNFLCNTAHFWGRVQLIDNGVLVDSWRSGREAVFNTSITCVPAPTELVQRARCSIHNVDTGEQFTSALGIQDGLPAHRLVIFNNITAKEPPGGVLQITSNVTVLSAGGPNETYVLDLAYLENVYNITPGVFVTINNLTLANLATTYIPPSFPYITSSLTMRVVAFLRVQVGALTRQLLLQDLIMVVPQPELDYLKYWITLLLSPVPEYKRQAAWLQISNFEVLPSGLDDDTLLIGRMVQTVSTFEVTRVTLVSQLPGIAPPREHFTGLARLLRDRIPLVAVTPVAFEHDMLVALNLTDTGMSTDGNGSRYITLPQRNVSLGSAGVWPAQPVPLKTNLVLGFTRVREVFLFMGYRPNLLLLPAQRTLRISEVFLANLPVRTPLYSRSDPLGVLATFLWSVQLEAQTSDLQLDNCTLMVHPEELGVLIQALVQPSPRASTADGKLIAAVRAFFGPATQYGNWGEDHLEILRAVTQRFTFTNVRIRSADALAMVAGSSLRSRGVPFSGGGSGGGGLGAGAIAGIVVGSVAGMALLAGAVWVGARHGRLRREQAYRTRGDNANANAPKDDQDSSICCSSVCCRDGFDFTNSKSAGKKGASSSTLRLPGSGGTSPRPSSDTLNTINTLTIAGMTSSLVSAGASSQPASYLKSPPSAALHHASIPSTGQTIAGTTTNNNTASNSASTASGTARSSALAALAAGNASHQPLSSSSAPGGSVSTSNVMPVSDSFNRPPDSQCHAAGFMMPGGEASQQQSVQSGTGSGQAGSGTTGSTSTGEQVDHQASLQQAIAMLGRDLGDQQLTVTSVLGKGASGTVYRGTWRSLQVAIKALLFSSDVDRDKQRALLEAAISSNLAHPNIVITYSYELKPIANVHELRFQSPELAGQEGWRLCIIQEYCDAGTLKEAVDRGVFQSNMPEVSVAGGQAGQAQVAAASSAPLTCASMRKCLEAAIQIASGMAHIHAKNVVHGDLNTSNVLLVRMPPKPGFSYTCKVADFGLSLRMPENQTHVSNLYQGTPYYVAPEVVLTGKMAKSADVYSFGIILWELHNGRRPPWRMQSRLPGYPLLNTGQLEFLPGCPPAYEALARRCFQEGKDQRPSFTEIMTALQEVAAGLGPEHATPPNP